MANSKQMEEICKIVECPLCLERMVDPRMLPCLHTFCERCLERHMVETKVDGSFRCPMCNKNTKVPSDGVTSFKRNFLICQVSDLCINDTGETSREQASEQETKKEEKCAICNNEMRKPKVLRKCKHTFCRKCIEEWFKQKPTCAICGELYGVVTGTQPTNGRMTFKSDDKITLEGYPRGTIVIYYFFPGGVQEGNHPHPGQRYYGTSRAAYLPNTAAGRRVADLLKKAFYDGLTFTIGRTPTSGQADVVKWTDIHHKTSPIGGPSNFGYPDPDYLNRVTEELRAKGIM